MAGTRERKVSSRPILLDINVLIALHDSAHIHHQSAHSWFAENISRGWRTCPITEMGFLRILSHPAYPNGPLPISDLAERLEALKSSTIYYAFWPEDSPPSSWLNSGSCAVGSVNLTDACLLKTSLRRQGALATFDLRIRPALIGESNPEILEYIPALF